MSIALSADSFAVSISNGLNLNRLNLKSFLLTPFLFGLAHFLNPIIGYSLGAKIINLIKNFDHWIAFGILFLLGIKMIFFENENERQSSENENVNSNSPFKILAQTIATSIDALAIGFTFVAFSLNIVYSAFVIGITVFLISISGVLLGFFFKMKNFGKINIISGSILILIGLKILLEHLLA